MPVATRSVRILRAVSGFLLLWLLAAAPAEATPAARADGARVCDVHTTLKTLRRQLKAIGGPLRKMARRPAAAGFIDMTARIGRDRRALIGDDDEAIQNDAPIARVPADGCRVPELLALGVLPCSLDVRRSSRAFTPRPPRGPPPSGPRSFLAECGWHCEVTDARRSRGLEIRSWLRQ
jgi:hypothetical protein